MQYIGVDLAWGEGSPEKPANETGVAVLDEQGVVHDADWLRGVDEVAEWLARVAEPGAIVAVDAPLVILNASGNRACESEVTTCYGRWQVAANASNTAMGAQAGVTLRRRLEEAGFRYSDGTRRADASARTVFECYPFTTLVGMWELGYDTERPRYKRLVPNLPPTEARALRAGECDDLLRRMAALAVAETPLDLRSHPTTARLLDEPSPVSQVPYKHREDLLDAVICAWTAAIWHQRGTARTQVLGATSATDEEGRRATIVAPARPEQRLSAVRGRGRRDGTAEAPAERTADAGSPQAALGSVREIRTLLKSLTAKVDALETELKALRSTERQAGTPSRPQPRRRGAVPEPGAAPARGTEAPAQTPEPEEAPAPEHAPAVDETPDADATGTSAAPEQPEVDAAPEQPEAGAEAAASAAPEAAPADPAAASAAEPETTEPGTTESVEPGPATD